MIEVQNLTKRYGRFTAVDGVSFRVEKGEILGFLGPNGAGKTTTMRILTGYMPATTGKALVGGFDVFDQPLEAKKRTGYLPETPPLYPEMTVREYLMFVARIKGVAAKAQRAQVDTSMEKTRVADVASRHCGKLSKGYRQRVGLAQAILHNPDVLILDEPTAGLDPKQIMETRDLIKSLAGDHTIVLSTHILPEVAQVCQRVVIINKGKVVADRHARQPDQPPRRRAEPLRPGRRRQQRRRRRGAGWRAGRHRRARRRSAGDDHRLRDRVPARPRHPPRSRQGDRRRRAGACSNCGRFA